MISLSEEAAKEIRDLASSAALKRDMTIVAESRRKFFIKDGKVDVDAYVEFVCAFNEFINHEPKKFVPMIDKDMRL